MNISLPVKKKRESAAKNRLKISLNSLKCPIMCYTDGMDEHAERMVSLETKLSYIEDFVDRLQTTVVEHTAEIERLKTENRALKTKLTDVEESLQDMPDTRPPHY